MPPPWERRWPDRLEYELRELVAAGAVVEIDKAAEAKDVRALMLEWPVGSRRVRLLAVYPDTFPYTRPEVFAAEPLTGRHVQPIEGGICLIGRGTHNWSSGTTLAALLTTQLPKVLAACDNPSSEDAASAEEHEGVPVEEWWNYLALPASHGLIDSGWLLPPAQDHGKVTLRCSVTGTPHAPIVRVAIECVKGADNAVLVQWAGRLPPELAQAPRMTVPWARVAKAPLPSRPPVDLTSLLSAHPSFARHGAQPVTSVKGLRIAIHCLVYPSELGWREYGDGWLFLCTLVVPSANKTVYAWLRTLRGGPTDFAVRAPAFLTLTTKRIAVFGAGAIGAPLAIELARNGAGELRIVEHDSVEPGNTVRWPFGTSAWGRAKLEPLMGFIMHEYPWTNVFPFPHRLGACAAPGAPDQPRSEQVLRAALDGIDLAIDVTAERGINWLLNDVCRERGVTLITAHATPPLTGGVVARFVYGSGSGCRTCLDHAWLGGDIPEPEGANVDGDMFRQPPGCAERTFVGANYDLGEISLQAVRLAMDSLVESPVYPNGSCVQIVRFVDTEGKRVPPVWQTFTLTPHRECQNPHS